ncbi:hypothetical protein E1B28_013065 [Marasmius oreades]|uniref:Uncharacterized protein n=1 Tax=Marasmius oreades TaxID=181124 RepID=A0A9P7RPQ6_9AGAR|nr:uncharacterized protein E1B28_013065 [Marasmius oreades]KAG7087083.1 hypothetical protein E1B28_013065 [Marasmius oreades]
MTPTATTPNAPPPSAPPSAPASALASSSEPLPRTQSDPYSTLLGVHVPNYPSDAKLTNAARQAVVKRGSDAGFTIDSRKVPWKSLDSMMRTARFTVVNYPLSVLAPWDLPPAAASKGIGGLSKSSRMLIVAACHEDCQYRLTFVSHPDSDIINNVVLILSYAPDCANKIHQVFYRDLPDLEERGTRAKGKVRKGKAKLSAEMVSDSEVDEEEDQLINDSTPTNITWQGQIHEDETPTARPQRVTRSKSQPPRASQSASTTGRAKSQAPTESPKKVSWEEPLSARKSSSKRATGSKSTTTALDDSTPASTAGDGISEANLGTGFTALHSISILWSKSDLKPPISANDLGDAMGSKRQSPSLVDEGRAKKVRLNDSSSAPQPPSTPQPPSIPQSLSATGPTGPPVAGIQHASTTWPSAPQPHLAPHPAPHRSLPHQQMEVQWPSNTFSHVQQHAVATPPPPGYPFMQPPAPQVPPEHLRALMAMAAASGFHLHPYPPAGHLPPSGQAAIYGSGHTYPGSGGLNPGYTASSSTGTVYPVPNAATSSEPSETGSSSINGGDVQYRWGGNAN